MFPIRLSQFGANAGAATHFKTRLNELAALAPASLDGTGSDDRSVEDLLRFVVLCASMRYDLSAARSQAERRLTELLFVPKPLSCR